MPVLLLHPPSVQVCLSVCPGLGHSWSKSGHQDPQDAPPPITARLRNLVNPKRPSCQGLQKTAFHESLTVLGAARSPSLQASCALTRTDVPEPKLLCAAHLLSPFSRPEPGTGTHCLSTTKTVLISENIGCSPRQTPRPRASPPTHEPATPSNHLPNPPLSTIVDRLSTLARHHTRRCLSKSAHHGVPILLASLWG